MSGLPLIVFSNHLCPTHDRETQRKTRRHECDYINMDKFKIATSIFQGLGGLTKIINFDNCVVFFSLTDTKRELIDLAG